MAKGTSTLAAKFAELVNVESSIRIRLHVCEPIPKKQQVAPAKGKQPQYFTGHEIDVPALGLVFEKVTVHHDYKDRLTVEQFPHLPKEVELWGMSSASVTIRHQGFLPSAKVTLPDGRELYIVESLEEIRGEIEKERQNQRAQIVEGLTTGLKSSLNEVLERVIG
jgi:hypothetical protein